MLLSLGSEMELSLLENGNGMDVEFEFGRYVRFLPKALRVDSLTKTEYVPIIGVKATIPEEFNICDSIDLQVIANDGLTRMLSNVITVSLERR